MGYPKKKRVIPPSRHDHVGNMVFKSDVAWCRECEQTWHMDTWPNGTVAGWKAVPLSEAKSGERTWGEW